MIQKILLSNLLLKRLMNNKFNLKEATEINLDETVDENKKTKKKKFFNRLKINLIILKIKK